MNKRNKSVIRWQWIVGVLGLIAVLVACATTGGGTETNAMPTTVATQVTPEAPLRLENGAIELQQENGGWIPVTGETTFEIAGDLESTDPWMVTGNTFATRATTQIDEGLEVEDRVKVKGVILEDGTWLAYSITRAEEQTDPILVLIGQVMSIDPWVVNGITLNVTPETLIGEGIESGMIVRVEILLLEDGTWEVVSIVSLAEFTAVPGCATVTATVLHVDGTEIQLAGWPVITLGEDVKIENDQGGEGTLAPNQVVLAVVCSSEKGKIMITHIIILNGNEGEVPSSQEGEKVLICHKLNKKGRHSISVAASAVAAHLAHGDKLGPCS